mgnify:CR=1 FL=1
MLFSLYKYTNIKKDKIKRFNNQKQNNLVFVSVGTNKQKQTSKQANKKNFWLVFFSSIHSKNINNNKKKT